MNNRVKIPLAIKYLIESNNELLQQYQDMLTKKVADANAEIMYMMGLDPADGWRIDTASMEYVQAVTLDKTQDASISK